MYSGGIGLKWTIWLTSLLGRGPQVKVIILGQVVELFQIEAWGCN